MKHLHLILNSSTRAKESSGSVQLARAQGKGILDGNDSRVAKLKAPGSTVERLGREGGTNNRPIGMEQGSIL